MYIHMTSQAGAKVAPRVAHIMQRSHYTATWEGSEARRYDGILLNELSRLVLLAGT